ncbi:linear amide C-N hydrolase [Mobilitalea sibirica]|uniref:Linear amide C-N hydrolase n=1 Tax=Mobilitalea sibirica TaxID=1462919 RepID=A0A8J7H0Z2_9FIRM|nr:carcinine hydrolase/isopenicillin-N N-acyltransferase family protein [Mobilitalea sibirica]MBH1939615.1 linear amide C-N hydrolase [Mobilitalea sibirica]
MKRIICMALILVFFLSKELDVSACTIFMKEYNGSVLAGNNEDWMYQISSNLWISAPGKNTYGRICFANSSYVQGGMNEKGLFYDGATCPRSEVPYDERKSDLGMDLGEIIISKCANVSEVIEMVKEYNIPSSYADHLMFADASGDSVVIEWMENDLKIIPKKEEYQLITNFWLSNPDLGGYPCSRYEKAKSMLEDSEKEFTYETMTRILDATSQDWGNGGTRYSNVYDLNEKVVYVYYMGDFYKPIKINLLNELKKMKAEEHNNYDLEDLFHNKMMIFETPMVGSEDRHSPSSDIEISDMKNDELSKKTDNNGNSDIIESVMSKNATKENITRGNIESENVREENGDNPIEGTGANVFKTIGVALTTVILVTVLILIIKNSKN